MRRLHKPGRALNTTCVHSLSTSGIEPPVNSPCLIEGVKFELSPRSEGGFDHDHHEWRGQSAARREPSAKLV